jgi:hypothetical protein
VDLGRLTVVGYDDTLWEFLTQLLLDFGVNIFGRFLMFLDLTQVSFFFAKFHKLFIPLTKASASDSIRTCQVAIGRF